MLDELRTDPGTRDYLAGYGSRDGNRLISRQHGPTDTDSVQVGNYDAVGDELWSVNVDAASPVWDLQQAEDGRIGFLFADRNFWLLSPAGGLLYATAFDREASLSPGTLKLIPGGRVMVERGESTLLIDDAGRTRALPGLHGAAYSLRDDTVVGVLDNGAMAKFSWSGQLVWVLPFDGFFSGLSVVTDDGTIYTSGGTMVDFSVAGTSVYRDAPEYAEALMAVGMDGCPIWVRATSAYLLATRNDGTLVIEVSPPSFEIMTLQRYARTGELLNEQEIFRGQGGYPSGLQTNGLGQVLLSGDISQSWDSPSAVSFMGQSVDGGTVGFAIELHPQP